MGGGTKPAIADWECKPKCIRVTLILMGLLDQPNRRRWFGAGLLAAALLMLLAGETVIEPHLGALGLLVFWLACLGLTIGAIVVAFLDARAVAHRSLKEQRDLFEATLRNIADDAKSKSRTKESEKPPRDLPGHEKSG